ncbi:unnamed protein product [Microthlaspi erraticum]|uniref:Arabidopsis retrotransposon Orf1 C-terminal domain-containing protein n=1 Tax=Microthlaspi erraticum TaxID=1685480 RepID=A0A6D2IWT4_9BRAS|nr:unnamed protein product [Microthlaspi erraticum]
MESYKELTCEFLASMRYHMYDEEDRADLDQGLGWITFLAKGEKRMVTFRQLGILFGFNYGEGTKWNFKEKELQRVWATIADGAYNTSINEGGAKCWRAHHPILCAAGVNPTDRRATEPGWMDIKFCKTNLLIEHKELDGRFQFKFTHPLVGPSKLLLPNPELTTVVRGENIDFRPPVYT